jgi:hypothetical protein
MTIHVSILGIDGSGKSTVAAGIASVLASELNVVAGSAGEIYRVCSPEEDHLDTKFHPDGLPATAYLNGWFRRAAKRLVDNRRLYPIFKIAQMIFKDATTRKIASRYGTDLMISDGNALLCAIGRAANYLRPASNGAEAIETEVDAADLRSGFEYILEGLSLPEQSRERLPGRFWLARLICRFDRIIRLNGIWLPDVVILLDISPKKALDHIASRRQKPDLHENEADLDQARRMYRKTLEALEQYRPQSKVYCIDVDNLSPGEVLKSVVEVLRPHIVAPGSKKAESMIPLGTTGADLDGNGVWKRVLNHRYLLKYLAAEWFSGAWREPAFAFSGLGRVFLKEGYSANVMRAIYDQDEATCGMFDRIFLNYPLHRTVYARLNILKRRVELVLEERLRKGKEVVIFTAPCGFSYDLFAPMESIAARSPEMMKQIRIVASDLDPHDLLSESLTGRAESLGVRFQFLRGDMTDEGMRRSFTEAGPYDIVLFIGLSSWLPKPEILRHLLWVRENIKNDGLLISDSFTPDAYALSGRYVGYKANYYAPEVYRMLIDYCGFDGLRAEIESGENSINHVLIASPRVHNLKARVA